MSLIAISILLAAASPAPKPPVARQHAIASVQIVAAEEIDFDLPHTSAQNPGGKKLVRQQRVRQGMPITEFY